jgi:hypothetical protein
VRRNRTVNWQHTYQRQSYSQRRDPSNWLTRRTELDWSAWPRQRYRKKLWSHLSLHRSHLGTRVETQASNRKDIAQSNHLTISKFTSRSRFWRQHTTVTNNERSIARRVRPTSSSHTSSPRITTILRIVIQTEHTDQKNCKKQHAECFQVCFNMSSSTQVIEVIHAFTRLSSAPRAAFRH